MGGNRFAPTRASESPWADGIGLCLGTLSDARGSIGEVSQPLLVRAR